MIYVFVLISSSSSFSSEAGGKKLFVFVFITRNISPASVIIVVYAVGHAESQSQPQHGVSGPHDHRAIFRGRCFGHAADGQYQREATRGGGVANFPCGVRGDAQRDHPAARSVF